MTEKSKDIIVVVIRNIFSHDFFNYTKDYNFVAVCGKHTIKMEDQNGHYTTKDWTIALKNSVDELSKNMKSDKIIRYLHTQNILTREDVDILDSIHYDKQKTREMLNRLLSAKHNPIHQLKIAMIKDNQSEMLQYLVKEDKKTKYQDL